MNRIQTFQPNSETSPVQSGARVEVDSGLYAAVCGDHTSALFAPLHYEPNYAYPMLVWLHGAGDDESQLKRIMPLVSLRNYVGAALRGTAPATADGRKPGYTWPQTRADVALAEQCVFDLIDLASTRFNIARQRVFLAGFDAGGTMAFRLAMAHPHRFAGILSLGGEFPIDRTPLVRLTDARRVPVFLACGRDSAVYPTEAVCENLKLFHTAGLSVALRQYPCGQQVMPLMLADMDRWMMEQIAASRAAQ
jgi:phospholipase/carboxylesterase